MSTARKTSIVTNSDISNTDVMLIRFLELLNKNEVLRKLKLPLFPQALSGKLDTLTQTITSLSSQLGSKERRIVVLEEKVDHLESECENLEHCPGRSYLRFYGILETRQGEGTTAKVVDTPKWPSPSVSRGHCN